MTKQLLDRQRTQTLTYKSKLSGTAGSGSLESETKLWRVNSLNSRRTFLTNNRRGTLSSMRSSGLSQTFVSPSSLELESNTQDRFSVGER